MKRTILRITSIITTVMLSLSIAVHGAVLHPIESAVDSTQQITISGQLEEGKNNRMLAITVSGPVEGGTEIPPLAHLGQTEVAFDGTYSYTFTLGGSTGNYNIEVSCGKEKGSDTFPFVNKELVDVILGTIDSAQQDEIESILLNKKKDLLIEDLDLYWNFPVKSIIITKLYQNKPYKGQYNKLISDITETAILYYINNADSVDAFKSVINQYQNDVKLNWENKTYKNILTDAQKESILTDMLSVEFTTLADVNKTFEEYCFSKAISDASLWQSIDNILRNNETLLNITFTDYDNLNDISAVCKKFLNQKLTLEKAKELFLSSVSEALEAEKNPVDKSPSGGSSKGSSKGGSYDVVAIVNNAIDNQNTASGSKFTDVSEVPWALEALNYLEKNGIISGVTEDTYEPMLPVTREQFVKILVNTFGIENSEDEVNFKDVDSNAWYYPYIVSATKSGIVSGKSDSLFGIGEHITRQDMAVLVYRCIEKSGYKPLGTDLKFNDSSTIADYAKEAIGVLKYANIVNGMGNGNYEPFSTTTRAQAAVIIYNAMRLTGFVEGM